MVVAKAQSQEMRRIVAVGIVTGLFCYLENFLLALISFLPRVFPEFMGLATFSTGAVVGVILGNKLRRGRKRI